MNENIKESEKSDGKQIEMMIDEILFLYRELKRFDGAFTEINKKSGNEAEKKEAENNLFQFKRAFDTTCDIAFSALNEIKESGHRFEIKILKDTE